MNNDELLLAISSMLDVKIAAGLKPIENRLDKMEERLDKMEKRLNGVENRLNGVENRLNGVESELTKLKLYNENILLPRLKMMESCYLDTYKRYIYYGDKMDAVIMDTELLKRVVTEHSGKLQQLAQ